MNGLRNREGRERKKERGREEVLVSPQTKFSIGTDFEMMRMEEEKNDSGDSQKNSEGGRERS